MKHIAFWLVVVLVAVSIQFLGRRTSAAKPPKPVAPASVQKIEGSNVARLTLLPEAARRLDIQTAAVREETIDPKQQVAGEVVSAEAKTAVVRVDLTESELSKVRRSEPAFILPLARDSRARRLKAQPLSGAIAQTLSLDSRARRVKALPLKQPTASGLYALPGVIHYETSDPDHGLVSRQLVLLELALAGGGEMRKLIPYAAVLYDAKGGTWVYTNPEPLVFIRQPIQIESIVGDDVLLTDGPPAGTAVVTVGGAELFGTEFGVGK